MKTSWSWSRILSVEVFWFSLIALFAIFSLLPLNGIIKNDFLGVNLVLALLFAFYFRTVVFFKNIPYLQFLAVQVILFLAHIPLFVAVMGEIQEMIYRFDSHDLNTFFNAETGLAPHQLLGKFQLFRSEFLLFAVGLLILVVFTELRIIFAFVERIRKIE